MIVPYSTDKSGDFIGYGAVGIIVACLVGFLLTWPAQRKLDQRLRTDSLHVWMEAMVERAERGTPPDGEEERLGPSGAERFLTEQFVPPSDPADIGRRMREVQWRESPLFRFGFHPAGGRWFPGILTYQFLHSGLLHLAGNLVFFFAFGVAMERRHGLGRFLVFYLAAGVFAGLAEIGLWSVFHPGRLPASTLVGASGSIAAVMGAFLRVHPASRVKVFVWLFRPRLGHIPAWAFLGAWFAMELLRGWLTAGSETSGGTAYLAHVAGFAFGFLLAPLIPLSDEVREEIAEERRDRARGVSITSGNPLSSPRPAPVTEPTAKPWVEQAAEALARGDREEAQRLFQRQIQSWLRGGSLERGAIADLVLRLEREHPQIALDPLVLWECGVKLEADRRNGEAARLCLRKVVAREAEIPATLRQRATEVLADLDRRALGTGREVPSGSAGPVAAEGGWRVD